MTLLIMSIAGILTVVLQGSVLSMFPLFGAQADLLLLFILSMALTRQSQEPVLFAIIFGALLDIIYSPQLGFYALSYFATAGVAVYSLKRLPRINMPTVLLTGLLGSLITQGICMLLAYAIGARFNVSGMFKSHIFPQAVLTSLLMLPAYYLIGKFTRGGRG